MKPFDLRKAIVNSIESTGDGLAAVKLQEGHRAVVTVAEMLTSMGDHQAVVDISSRLLKDFTEEELNEANPNLIIALCGCLSEALLRLGASFAK